MGFLFNREKGQIDASNIIERDETKFILLVANRLSVKKKMRCGIFCTCIIEIFKKIFHFFLF